MAGRIHELSIPSNVIKKPKPGPNGAANINIILTLLESVQNIPGDVAECGVFRGHTLIPMAAYLKKRNSHKHVYGFDSFAGFPSSNDAVSKNAFATTSLTLVQDKLNLFHLQESVTLVPGFFNESIRMCQKNAFSFIHLDCDIYESYRDCLSFFYPRLNRGGIILLDEYNEPYWPGCNRAVDEFLADKPEHLECIDRQNYQKYFFRKL